MLRVESLTASLEGRNVLDGIDLEVADREIVAVLGPSGCGKTTLLRSIAGLQAVDHGTVSIDGVDVSARAPHEREVGLMFQHYALFPHLDVHRNVEFGLRMRGIARAQRAARVAEVVELTGLHGLEHRRVDQLSGGEQQRVALARALAPAPRLLMLDEPLGALDRTLRDRLLLDLQDLFARLGTTVVYVTHDQAEALAVADRVVVMRDGRVEQAGSARDVWERPANAFVARFLGFDNLFAVRPSGDGAPAGSDRAGFVTAWGLSIEAAPGTTDRERVVLVRPAAVRIMPDASASAWRGVVVGHVYQGDTSRVRVRLEAGVTLDADVAGPPPHAGQEVGVDIDPAGVHVVDAEGGAG